jgi:hypothetical protein
LQESGHKEGLKMNRRTVEQMNKEQKKWGRLQQEVFYYWCTGGNLKSNLMIDGKVVLSAGAAENNRLISNSLASIETAHANQQKKS